MKSCINQFSEYEKRRKNTERGLLIGIALVMIALPLILSDYMISVAVVVALNALTVLGLNLVMGYAGQISLGHAAFCGVGAYVSAIISVRTGLPPALTLVLAAFAAGLLAYIVGIPTFKLKGHYLAMATLALGIIFYEVVKQEIYITGGPTGYPSFMTKGKIMPIAIAGFEFDSNVRMFGLASAFLLAAMIISLNIYNSRVGRALRSIHDNDIASGSLGIDYAKYKVRVFILSAIFASVSGSLYAHHIKHITPSVFGFHVSVELVAMVVIGGMGSVFGSLLGAILLTTLPETLHSLEDFEMVFFGLIMMLVMIFLPGGLAAAFGEIYNFIRRLFGASDEKKQTAGASAPKAAAPDAEL